MLVDEMPLTSVKSSLNPMIADLPAVAPFRLRNHQLAQVICQVRFSPVLRLGDQERIADFQDRIRTRYPQFVRQVGLNLLVTPNGVAQQPQDQPIYRFAEADGSVELVLGTDFVAIEARAYTSIEELEERTLEGLRLVGELYAPPMVTRVGLRFINEFRFQSDTLPEALAEAFHPMLLGLAGVEELRGAVGESHAAARLEGESNQVVVQYGLKPAGTTVLPSPGITPLVPPADPFYLLDVDAFSDQAFAFDIDAVAERVRIYNDQGRALFAWAVRPGYRRDILGEEALSG
jgi:uncharacterized protein (TIGR04255 family)